MLKTLWTLSLLAATLTVAAAETNLLQNAAFGELNQRGVPAQWELRSKNPTQLTVADGEVTLRADPAAALLMQRNLPLENGKKYRLSGEASGSGEREKYLIYIEWTQKQPDGKKTLKGVNSSLKTATEDWSKTDVTFTYPENGSGAYAVISSRSGTVKFRNIRIVAVP